MIKLKITCVGPITKTATIEYDRFCILIGPQSNGKSTIAKILSTCLWLEKEACTSLSDNIIENGEDFKKLVEDFHRMHGYINPEKSSISYESQFVKIIYDKGDFAMSFKDHLGYNRKKISYVPSDRNVVTMKDIEKRDLEPTNFRSFLFDWLDTNRNYNQEHKAPILNLNIQYYYNDTAKDRKDMLTHENGVTYDIPLYDASSGMQSLVPMTVLMHYLVSGYFENYGKEKSFEQQQKETNLSWSIAEIFKKKYYPELDNVQEFRNVIKSKADEHDESAIEIINEMKELYFHLVNPQSISFILEEPEQNLFPQTQVDLFNDIISLCEGEHKSSVFITTHSPYILSAANILLFVGKLMEQGASFDEISKTINTKSFIRHSEFTAYSVSDGTCTSIIDEKTHLINENMLDSASDYNAEVFDSLYKKFINLQK